MFGLGPIEIALIGGIVLMIFGPGIVKRGVKTFMETRATIKQMTKGEDAQELKEDLQAVAKGLKDVQAMGKPPTGLKK